MTADSNLKTTLPDESNASETVSQLAVTLDNTTYHITVDLPAPGESVFTVTVDGETLHVEAPDLGAPLGEMEWIVVEDRPYEIVVDRDLRWISTYSAIHHVEVHDLSAAVVRPRSGDGRVKAPIPGLITRVLVSAGQTVQAGQPLLTLEAMKMENEIRAPRAGTVSALNVDAGKTVARHDLLAEIT